MDNAVSLYAATKNSNEFFAHCYSKLSDPTPTTDLRFPTVYGSAGLSNMACIGFTNKLLAGKTVQLHNYDNGCHDHNNVGDIAEGIVRVMGDIPERKTGYNGLPVPPYKDYSIGGEQLENLLDFVQILQVELMHTGILLQDYDFAPHKQLVPM